MYHHRIDLYFVIIKKKIVEFLIKYGRFLYMKLKIYIMKISHIRINVYSILFPKFHFLMKYPKIDKYFPFSVKYIYTSFFFFSEKLK